LRPDLLPYFRTKLSMIRAKENGKGYVEEQAHGSADDRGARAVGSGRKAEDVAREVGVSKHTTYAWKAKYGGMDVSHAQDMVATHFLRALSTTSMVLIQTLPLTLRTRSVTITLTREVGEAHLCSRALTMRYGAWLFAPAI